MLRKDDAKESMIKPTIKVDRGDINYEKTRTASHKKHDVEEDEL